MAKEIISVDIGGAPELLRLAEEVQVSRTARLLTHNGREVAVLTPVEQGSVARKRPARRDRRTGPRDPLWNIIGLGAGIGADEGPSNVAEDKYRYLADVYDPPNR